MSVSLQEIHVCATASPVAIESFCAALSRTAQGSLQRIASAIEQDAPMPGRVVYVHAKSLGLTLNGLQPAVFSAVDAATQLQVAQIDFAKTSAAAYCFVEFLVRSFPFPVQEVRTRKAIPFHYRGDHRPHRALSVLIRPWGLAHSLIEVPSEDPLFSITSKLVFGELNGGSAGYESSHKLQKALDQFLFFHNNFRLLPWLGEKTPVQKLGTFEGFQNIHSFNLTDEPDRMDFRELKDTSGRSMAPVQFNHLDTLSRRKQ